MKGILSKVDIVKDGNIKNDIYKYYFKHRPQAVNKLSKFKVVSCEYLEKHIENKMGKLSELAMLIAWILGCGEKDKLKNVKKIGKHFGRMYQIALDFENIDNDVNNSVDMTLNYVVNCGFQNSYEKFMQSKQIFIEGLITLDIYTGTLKELIDLIEMSVNNTIDQTSPDLMSNYSTIQSVTNI